MKTQEKKSGLAVFNAALAPTDLVKGPLGGPMVCTTKQSVALERISPQLSGYEARMRARRQRQVEREQKKKRMAEIRNTPQPYD